MITDWLTGVNEMIWAMEAAGTANIGFANPQTASAFILELGVADATGAAAATVRDPTLMAEARFVQGETWRMARMALSAVIRVADRDLDLDLDAVLLHELYESPIGSRAPSSPGKNAVGQSRAGSFAAIASSRSSNAFEKDATPFKPTDGTDAIRHHREL